MSRPVRAKSHDAVSSASAGETFETKGHTAIGLFVVARNLDTGSDTLDVRVEASPTGSGGEWTTIDSKKGGGGSKTTRLSLGANDFEDTDGDGTYVAFLFAAGIPAQYVRANITTFTDASGSDLEADSYIMLAGNGGTGHGYVNM